MIIMLLALSLVVIGSIAAYMAYMKYVYHMTVVIEADRLNFYLDHVKSKGTITITDEKGDVWRKLDVSQLASAEQEPFVMKLNRSDSGYYDIYTENPYDESPIPYFPQLYKEEPIPIAISLFGYRNDVTHYYSFDGEGYPAGYKFHFQGQFYNVSFYNSNNLSIHTEWSRVFLDSGVDMFRDASVLVFPENQVLSGSCKRMFYHSGTGEQKEIKESASTKMNSWDVSKVTNMSQMFMTFGIRLWNFNVDFSNWNTSNVTDMSMMFSIADPDADTIVMTPEMGILAIGVKDWDTSNVTNMFSMFRNNVYFESSELNWNTSKVENMAHMFHNASSFNPQKLNWDTSNVKTMEFMFADAYSFATDVSQWDVSNVTKMKHMFNSVSEDWFGSYKNMLRDTWNVDKVEDVTTRKKTTINPYGNESMQTFLSPRVEICHQSLPKFPPEIPDDPYEKICPPTQDKSP